MIALPGGYVMIERMPVRAAVREDLSAALRAWVLAAPLPVLPAAEPIDGGRGGAYRVVLPDGPRAVVRPYRRGGLLGPVLRDWYVGRRPRPFQELVVTVTARARGVTVPEVLAARVEGHGCYRATLITVELSHMVPLVTALRRVEPGGDRHRLAGSAGRSVGRMHAAGVCHADLNLSNILVLPATPDAAAAIIDFDRGWVSTGRLPAAARLNNLARFERSRRKLDPEGILMDAATSAAFRAGYDSGWETACAS